MFGEQNEKLVSAPNVISSDWIKLFKVMCDASGVSLGVVFGKRKDKILHPIYYASKDLSEAQMNYTVIEQELLVVGFSSKYFALICSE